MADRTPELLTEYEQLRQRPGPTASNPGSLGVAIADTLALFRSSYEGKHPIGQEMCEQILRNQLAILYHLLNS